MTETGNTGQEKNPETNAAGGWRRYRGLVLAVSGVALMAGIVAGTVAFNTTGEAETKPATYAPPTVAGASIAPSITSAAFPGTATPDSAVATSTLSAPTESPEDGSGPESAAATSAASSPTGTTTVAPTVGDAASSTPTVGDSWTATPGVSTPGPTDGLWPAASSLIAQIEGGWGIDVVTPGQNWGANEEQQLRNLGALYGALAALPGSVVSQATHNDHGTLAVLSNNAGRMLAGWQPYGDVAANFYANEDFGPNGRIETSQIVLQTGSTQLTIAHELLHAFQMRNVAAGRYGQALLTAEMTSFMAATGWTANVSPEALTTSVNGSWDQINALFSNTGPELVYVDENGDAIHAHTPNPVEAFAVVGALYYAAPDGLALPAWDAYWAWYATNLG